MKSCRVGIINYGIGNIGSIVNMLNHVENCIPIVISEDSVSPCDKYILPGVGAFSYGMSALAHSNVLSVIQNEHSQSKPILGICLGMQLLFERSEESQDVLGLGWLKGSIKKFNFSSKNERSLKIPHMGWSDTMVVRQNELFSDLEHARFYHVHSYHAENCSEIQLATAEYGYTFTTAVQYRNLYGVQFHPERSHRFGLQLFSNFVNKCNY